MAQKFNRKHIRRIFWPYNWLVLKMGHSMQETLFLHSSLCLFLVRISHSVHMSDQQIVDPVAWSFYFKINNNRNEII